MAGAVAVRVHLYGVIRHLVGAREATETDLELPDGFTLGDVVDALAARYGDRLRGAMVSMNYLQGHVKVFVDGEEVEGGLDRRLGAAGVAGNRVDVYFVPIAEGGEEQPWL